MINRQLSVAEPLDAPTAQIETARIKNPILFMLATPLHIRTVSPPGRRGSHSAGRALPPSPHAVGLALNPESTIRHDGGRG
jgi:hypothetical protein